MNRVMPIFLVLGAILTLIGVAVTVAVSIIVGGPLLILLVVLVKKIVAAKTPPVLDKI